MSATFFSSAWSMTRSPSSDQPNFQTQLVASGSSLCQQLGPRWLLQEASIYSFELESQPLGRPQFVDILASSAQPRIPKINPKSTSLEASIPTSTSQLSIISSKRHPQTPQSFSCIPIDQVLSLGAIRTHGWKSILGYCEPAGCELIWCGAVLVEERFSMMKGTLITASYALLRNSIEISMRRWLFGLYKS